MTGEHWGAIEALFHELVDLDEASRATRLTEISEGDPDLGTTLRRLLAAHDRSDELLGPLDAAMARPVPPDALARDAFHRASGPLSTDPLGLIGRTVSGYRIVSFVGAGGMGMLYEAHDPRLSRQAALKFLPPHLGVDPSYKARFLREARAAAALDHPNVCAIWEVGETPEGEPYIAMPLYSGHTVRELLAEGPLPPERALALVRQAACGLEAAHAAGLVHRDIKPANLMVTDDGTLKILDFGIVKIGDPTPDGERDRAGTPAYMSPEQAKGEEIDARTDVWALGAVLYEMLTGRRSSSRPRGAAQAAIRAAARRGTRAGANDTRLSRDLAAIVLMSLRTDPAERYASVASFARDMERYVQGLPVEARAAGRVYRVRKFLHRHPIGAMATSVASLVLMVGAISTVRQARMAHREREFAAAARSQASAASARARGVTDALRNLFEGGDPRELGPADSATVRTLIALGRSQVDSLADQPIVQADLLDMLVRINASTGQLAVAESLSDRALAARHSVGDQGVGLASSLNSLALLRKAQGRYREAEERHREALAIQIERLGPDHLDVAETLTMLATRLPRDGFLEREELYRRALEIRRAALGSAHPLVASSLMDLGRVRRSRGLAASAETFYREAIRVYRDALGPQHPSVARSQVFLADLMFRQLDDLGQAEALYREAIAGLRSALGERHSSLIQPQGNLAALLSERGDHAAAERLYRETLEVRRAAFGRESRDAAVGLAALAHELQQQGRLDEAERLQRESLRMLDRLLGSEHWTTAGHMLSLAEILIDRAQYEEARSLLDRALRIWIAIRGERHSAVGLVHGMLGRLEARVGDRRQAESHYLRGLEIFGQQRSSRHPDVRRLHRELADLYAAWGRPEEARMHRTLGRDDTGAPDGG